MKPLDHAGKVYGRLTVLHRVENNARNHAVWAARCICGCVRNYDAGLIKRDGGRPCRCPTWKAATMMPDGTATVPLTQGFRAIIDAADVPLVTQFKWCVEKGTNTHYAVRCHNGKTLSLHRFLLQCADGEFGDHINRNGLDCRRVNLRKCNWGGNIQNSPARSPLGYKGVTRKRGKYRARICVNDQEIYLGLFETPEEAAQAYDAAVRHHRGGMAATNFNWIGDSL